MNLETMSQDALLQLQKDVAAALKSFESRKRKEAMAAMEEAAKSHGFSMAELMGKKAPAKKASAKYANPEDPSETWSGRGRRPAWVVAYMDAGNSLVRAKWIAETFFENALCINDVRGMLGFTGTWQGNPVTVHGSGMGMPSLSIYANELIKVYGVETLIRVGSTGAMQEKVKIRDVILAMTASTISTPSSAIFKEVQFAPCIRSRA